MRIDDNRHDVFLSFHVVDDVGTRLVQYLTNLRKSGFAFDLAGQEYFVASVGHVEKFPAVKVFRLAPHRPVLSEGEWPPDELKAEEHIFHAERLHPAARS